MKRKYIKPSSELIQTDYTESLLGTPVSKTNLDHDASNLLFYKDEQVSASETGGIVDHSGAPETKGDWYGGRGETYGARYDPWSTWD